MKKVEISQGIKHLKLKKINFCILFLFLTLQQHSIKSEITVGFMGDVMLGRNVSDYLDTHKNYTFLWNAIVPILKNNDFNIANLETTFTEWQEAAQKTFTFKSNPIHVQALKEANIGIVNLANNHILDFGKQGLEDTIKTLDSMHIQHAGAGSTLQQAQAPVFFESKGISFALLGITDNEPEWLAAHHKAGTNYIPIDKSSLLPLTQQIKELKKKVDNVIVSIHWGPNWNIRPPEIFRNFAHTLIRAGADVIHGHSAHIFQGIEIYKNKIILYSTGDFIDDYAIDEKLHNDRSFLFLISFTQKGPESLRLIPIIIKNMQVTKAPYATARAMFKKIQSLSQELNTSISTNGTWKKPSL